MRRTPAVPRASTESARRIAPVSILAQIDAALKGRYRLERELGAGGMATVFLAKDLKHDRPVAIKVLRPELAALIGAERILSEMKTTANLQHGSLDTRQIRTGRELVNSGRSISIRIRPQTEPAQWGIWTDGLSCDRHRLAV